MLIEWFQKNYKHIRFARMRKYDTYKRIEKLSDAIERLDPNVALFEQPGQVAEIWRNLVGKAIVYLKSKDGREKYHDGEDYGVDRLHGFFEAFRDFEPLLYAAEDKRYRDHMTHMLSVFLLGEYFITERIGFENVIVNDEKLPKKCKVSAAEKEAMWCLASLTHDLGMALEKMPTITPKVRDMMEQFGILDVQPLSCTFPLQPLHEFALRFISSDLEHLQGAGRNHFLTHIQPKYFLKFSEALERRDHGMISCLVLMKHLVYFLESDFLLDTHRPFKSEDAKQFLIRRNILRSIAAHNCRSIYHLKVPEFPFLLTLFDDMQEWGRPRFVDMFGRTRPETTVIVKEFNIDAVHYKVIMACSENVATEERQLMARETVAYFLGKCNKIKMILRSAVVGEYRNLKLTFEVVDELQTQPIRYKIVHERPDSVAISEDGQPMDWLHKLEELKSSRSRNFA